MRTYHPLLPKKTIKITIILLVNTFYAVALHTKCMPSSIFYYSTVMKSRKEEALGLALFCFSTQ